MKKKILVALGMVFLFMPFLVALLDFLDTVTLCLVFGLCSIVGVLVIDRAINPRLS